jgi:two-component system chemotaxis response regulator CheB
MPDASEPAPERPRGEAVVVAGASAGGVEALVQLVRSLPADFPHPVLVVLHVAPTGTSVLPAILSRACRLVVGSPADGEELRPGHVYVAPPDRHLVVADARLRLSQTPRENGHRPAIDATMRTTASAYDGATIGIVLSGSRDDGTAGLMAIKASGGTAIVQDPDEALYPSMPLSALAHVEADAVLPVRAMAAWILSSAQAEALETALCAAVRSLEDRAALLRRLANRGRANEHLRSAAHFERQAEEGLARARTVREAIQQSSEDRATVAES